MTDTLIVFTKLLLARIARVDRTALQLIQKRLAERGVTLAEFRLIGALLGERVGITQRELAERLQITAASLSALVGRLEKKGLVERTPDESDARAFRVRCTPRIAEYDWVHDVVVEVERRATRGVSAADLETTRRVLAAMIGNLEVEDNPIQPTRRREK
ncbi:MarR family winged helix-turn-helix transcriptional regulator [Sorangium sp. So ce233]|uniref:MarR family winged helix-turn-helix transcriptional regulator n=1 Tax=Sorangium sp. So ce233 TaxID=3133290 RepID=UPI003F60DCD5